MKAHLQAGKNPSLVAIKVVHTVIWVFFVSVIFYVLYSGIANEVNVYTWVCMGLVVIEALVLVVFRMHCPLTLMARKYSDSNRHNFDIYLPEVIAKYNKQIFTSIFLVGTFLVLFRVIAQG